MPSIPWIQSGFPPYGLMPTLATVSTQPPADWRGTPADFATWLDHHLAWIARDLWPVYDSAQASWQGQACQSMRSLTEADLSILLTLCADGPSKALHQLPRSPLRHLGCPLHQSFYEAEDGGTPIADPRRMYDSLSNSDTFLNPLGELFGRGIRRKSTLGMIYWFKDKLQRPRPYQSALLLGKTFKHEAARSGLHPAIISGHCFQGMAALTGIAERLLLDRLLVTADQWASLCQYCIDFGDRRVMAGVHFPSDNLASWVLMLNLVPHVVDPQVITQTAKVLSDAIRGSIVYQAIRDQAQSPGSPFGPAFKVLTENLASSGGD